MSSFIKTSPTFFFYLINAPISVTHGGTYGAWSARAVRKTRRAEKLFIVQTIYSSHSLAPFYLNTCVYNCYMCYNIYEEYQPLTQSTLHITHMYLYLFYVILYFSGPNVDGGKEQRFFP